MPAHPTNRRAPCRRHSIRRGKEVLLSGRTPALSIEAVGPRKVMIGREAIFKVTLQERRRRAGQRRHA